MQNLSSQSFMLCGILKSLTSEKISKTNGRPQHFSLLAMGPDPNIDVSSDHEVWVKPEGPWIYQFPPSIKYNFPSKAKALLREAPKGFDTLEVEHLSAPVPVKELHFLGRGWRATCDVFGRYEDWFPTRFLIGLFATRKVEHPSGRMINLTTSSKKDHWISCRVMSRERR